MEQSLGKIHIRKRTVPEWLVSFVFFLPFFQAFISEFLGLPDVIKFLSDAFLALLLLKLCLISTEVQISKAFWPFLVLVGLFFAYVTVSYFFNYRSIFYYIWGLRNYFRFYVAFTVYIIFLKWEDVQRWLKFLDFLYVVNLVLVLVQFGMGFRQDYLGGIFGTSIGCNGGLFLFLTLITAKTVLSFMRNECGVIKCMSFALIAITIATLAEIKFFFIIFIAIVIVSALMTKWSFRKSLFFIFCAIIVWIFSTILSLLYDDFQDFLTWDSLRNALINPNYSTNEDIGRFTAVPIISEQFLPHFFDKLFGIGLGNADSASLSIFNTSFYEAYKSIRYTYFSYAFLFLETGIVGLILYVMFFVVSFVVSLRLYIAKKADEMICQLAMIFSGICVMLMFYNSSLRTEMTGYLAYFVLALPLISSGAAKPRD